MKKESKLTSLPWCGMTPISLIWRARFASISLYVAFVFIYFLINDNLTEKYRELFVWFHLSNFLYSYKDFSLLVHLLFSGLVAHLIVNFYLVFYYFISAKQVEIRREGFVKVIINFILTIFFAIAVCAFFIQNPPDLEDPLGFVSIALISYLMTGAIIEFVKYFPILFCNPRSES